MLDLFFFLFHEAENSFFEIFSGQYLALTILIFFQMVKNVRKLFIAFSSHVRSFIWNVCIVSYAFKYVRDVKIRHMICNLITFVFLFLIVYYDLSISVEHSLSTSSEYFCDKVLLTMLCFDSSLFVEQFCDKILCTMMCFDLSFSVELTFEDGAVISV